MAEKSDKAKGEKRFDIEEDLSKVEVPDVLPVLPLRGIVIFPNQIHPFLVSRPASLRLIEDVGQASRVIGLSAQKNPEEENPAPDGLFPRGTAVRILKMLKYPDHSVRVLVQGIARIDLLDFVQLEPYFRANVRRLAESVEGDKELDALQAHLVSQFSKFVSLVPYLPDELQVMAMQVREPARLTDMVASYLKIAVEESQDLLSTNDVRARLEKLIVILGREIELLELGHKIQSQVQTELNKNQREYYLRQQLKAIQKELGEGDARSSEIEDLEKKIEAAKMPEDARKAADKELDRLKMIPPESAEHTVVRTYLDWLVSLPWAASTDDNLDIKHARAVLDEDHFDLEKVKERILEFLAVRKLKSDTKGPILCFVGPPGTGKTSLGRSIARALGRKFVRLSLGGIRDEAEIRGHRRTYIGSLPGRMIQGLRNAGSNNPLFILDEVDKLGTDFRGDPASALLEVLDPLPTCSIRFRRRCATGWKCWSCPATPRRKSSRSRNATWCPSRFPRMASAIPRSSSPRKRCPKSSAATRVRPACATSSAKSAACAARSRAPSPRAKRRPSASRPTPCTASWARASSSRKRPSTPRSPASRRVSPGHPTAATSCSSRAPG